MKNIKSKLLVLGLVSVLGIGCLGGFTENSSKYSSIIRDNVEYVPVFGVQEVTMMNDIHDRIVIPSAVSSYSMTNSEGYIEILEDANGHVQVPESAEWDEWISSQYESIVEISNPPRNIASYIRPDNGKTVIEIAGYYTDINEVQVEYYDTKTFDFLFTEGYDFYEHQAPDVVEIPTTAATWFSDTISPYESGQKQNANKLSESLEN